VRFPPDSTFRLKDEEAASLRSPLVPSNKGRGPRYDCPPRFHQTKKNRLPPPRFRFAPVSARLYNKGVNAERRGPEKHKWRLHMRIIVVCSMAVLACSCHQATEDSLSVHKQSELSKIVDEYFREDPYSTKEKCTFQFRGPLTIDQVEQESLEATIRSPRKDLPPVPFAFSNDYWVELRSKHRDGDKFYFFVATATPSYSQVAGYVLIHGRKVVGGITAWMN
jgi:hypothetical protein